MGDYANKRNILVLLAAVFLTVSSQILLYADQNSNWKPAKGLPSSQDVNNIVKARVTKESNQIIEIEYLMPEIEAAAATKAGETDKEEIHFGNAPLAENEGEPVLPVVPVRVVLPCGYELDSIEASGLNKIELAGKHKIVHGAKPIPLVPENQLTEEQKIPASPNPAIYDFDNIYPASKYTITGVQKKRGVSILYVNLNPVEYLPKSGRVSYYKNMEVKVKTKQASVSRSKQGKNKYRRDPAILLEDKVDNPATLNTYTEAAQSLSRASGQDHCTYGGICNPTENYRYVLITSREIINAGTTPNVGDFLKKNKIKA